ncbi:hypothetical protein D3C80_1639900 [compost metagenome]
MFKHLVDQPTGVGLGACAEELALGQGDFPALLAARLGLFALQNADQQARLLVLHVLLDPADRWPGQVLLAFLAHAKSQAAQAFGLLLGGALVRQHAVPAAHLRGGAPLALSFMLLRGNPAGQPVAPPQLGLVGVQAGDQQQLAESGLHLLLALLGVLAGREG